MEISEEPVSASSPGFAASKGDGGQWKSWSCFCHGAPSVAVPLVWCVENRELSALCGNSQNKLLSVLGPLCLLRQHLALTLALSVFLLLMFSRGNPSWREECYRCPRPGTDLGTWQEGGRQEGGGGTEIPAHAAVLPPSQLPRPRHLLPSASLSRQEGLWPRWVGAQGMGGPAGLLSRAVSCRRG